MLTSEDSQSSMLPSLPLPIGLASDKLPILASWVGGGQPPVATPAFLESILQHGSEVEQAGHREVVLEGTSAQGAIGDDKTYRGRLQEMMDKRYQVPQQPVFDGLRSTSAPPGTVGDDLTPESWYRSPTRQPTERPADGVPRQPEFIRREPTSVPLPPSPSPPFLEQLMSFLRESHLAQTATFQQQQDLARYMRELNEWLARDVNDRHSELRVITTRLDFLTSLTNELLNQRFDEDDSLISKSETEEGPVMSMPQPSGTWPSYQTPIVPPVSSTLESGFAPVIPAPPSPMPDHHAETNPTNRLDILASLKNVLSKGLHNADEASASQQHPTEIPMPVPPPYHTPALTPLQRILAPPESVKPTLRKNA